MQHVRACVCLHAAYNARYVYYWLYRTLRPTLAHTSRLNSILETACTPTCTNTRFVKCRTFQVKVGQLNRRNQSVHRAITQLYDEFMSESNNPSIEIQCKAPATHNVRHTGMHMQEDFTLAIVRARAPSAFLVQSAALQFIIQCCSCPLKLISITMKYSTELLTINAHLRHRGSS